LCGSRVLGTEGKTMAEAEAAVAVKSVEIEEMTAVSGEDGSGDGGDWRRR
jgi:hypothetical protein